jgi:4-diphosphocytidyl-2-C-methyl-D-erythritol kinase
MFSLSKINLFLKVTGRCDNSYHSIRTLFMPLATPADEININFGVSSGISIICDSPEVPCDEHNLCYKAAVGYAEACGMSPEWEISIGKNIPVAAGMGGGSSNAATVLKILNEEYRKLTHAEITAIALRCGADVPFFLVPRPALASGIGNVFEYPEIDFPEIPLLLINPGFPISAAWAYKNLSPANIGTVRDGYELEVLNALEKADLEKLSELIINDLAITCYKKFPLLEILRTELLESGAAAAEITGSGPTLFALFESPEKRDISADFFKQNYPQMTIIKSILSK